MSFALERDDTMYADIKIGSEKLTLQNGEPVELKLTGTTRKLTEQAYTFKGTVNALDKITISVFDPDDREVDRIRYL